MRDDASLPDEESLEELRIKVGQQEQTIKEMSRVIKKLSMSFNDAISVQNEIAKQVMFLSQAVDDVQELLMGPKPSYKFFRGDEPEN